MKEHDDNPEQFSKQGQLDLSEADWRQRLSEDEFRVLRQKGTERAFTGPYWDSKRDGVYRCAGCGAPLFDAATKFESGSGWPSFWQPVSEHAVTSQGDFSHGMARTEAVCARCGGHLGHVFPDGPEPSGQRYCINSVSLDLDEDRSLDGESESGE
jgi:peptide-methionine (R)-S-oxide reductase